MKIRKMIKRCFHRTFLMLTFCMAITESVQGQSQTNKEYLYDASGNQVSAVVINYNNGLGPSLGNAGGDGSTLYSTQLSGKTITVTMENSGTVIGVEVAGWTSSDDCRVVLYNAGGQQLASRQAHAQKTLLEIGSAQDGVYILWVTLNGETLGLKIVKNN